HVTLTWWPVVTCLFFLSSRRRHTRFSRDWSSDVCSSDLDRFELNQEALSIISSIEEDIIVVAIVGKARTGKSYLMNLLLDRTGRSEERRVGKECRSRRSAEQ